MFRSSIFCRFAQMNLWLPPIWMLMATMAFAQASEFTYQGRLNDGGVPATGLYDLQFKLFNASVSGTQQGGTVVRDDVQITGGVFTITLDFGATVFPGTNRWLEVAVRPGASSGAFTARGPLQALTSTPYAIRSLSAGTADGLSVACTNCVTAGQLASGTIVDANINGSAAIAPTKIAGTAATLGANTFTGSQSISTGNLALSNTTGASSGALILGGTRFLHNYGGGNTFVGPNAGNLTMTGSGNTASGINALLSNTTGDLNTVSGAAALTSNTTGGSNTAVGTSTLQSNTTGGGNTAVGVFALGNNTTGGSNTASGGSALSNNTIGNSNMATGQNALLSNTTGSNNTASGYQALLLNTTGSNNTASGLSALSTNTTGSSNTAIGYGADVNSGALSDATAIGTGAVVNASNKIRLGNAAVTVIEGQVAYTFTSDKTKKENFQQVNAEEVLRKLAAIDVPTWNYIGHDANEFRHYGPMAQDFFAAFGSDGTGTIGTPTSINSGDQAGILMLAVKALERRTADSQTENQALKAENTRLQQMIETLQTAVDELQVVLRKDDSRARLR